MNLLARRDITVTVAGGHEFTFKPGTPQWTETIESLQGHYTDEELLENGSTTEFPRQ